AEKSIGPSLKTRARPRLRNGSSSRRKKRAGMAGQLVRVQCAVRVGGTHPMSRIWLEIWQEQAGRRSASGRSPCTSVNAPLVVSKSARRRRLLPESVRVSAAEFETVSWAGLDKIAQARTNAT